MQQKWLNKNEHFSHSGNAREPAQITLTDKKEKKEKKKKKAKAMGAQLIQTANPKTTSFLSLFSEYIGG